METHRKVRNIILFQSMSSAQDAPARTDDVSAGAEEALARHLADDPEAFAQLYDIHCDRIYRYVLHRIGNRDDSADLTQQIFMKALRARDRYQPNRGSFASWIFAIARSQVISFGGRQRTDFALSAVPEASVPSSQGPGDSTLQIDETERLRACVGRLGTRDQELIGLRFDADLTVPEMAAVVHRNVEATKKQLQRALKRLQETYDDDPR